MEEHIVDHAEDNRGSADAEGQCEDGDQGETPILSEVAEGVAEVARQTIEVGFHTSKLYTEAAANYRTSRFPPHPPLPCNPTKLPFNPQFRRFPAKYFPLGYSHASPPHIFALSPEGFYPEPRRAASPTNRSPTRHPVPPQPRPRLQLFHQSGVTNHKSLSLVESAITKKPGEGPHPRFRPSVLLAGRSPICPRPPKFARPADHSARLRHQPPVTAHRSLHPSSRIRQAGV